MFDLKRKQDFDLSYLEQENKKLKLEVSELNENLNKKLNEKENQLNQLFDDNKSLKNILDQLSNDNRDLVQNINQIKEDHFRVTTEKQKTETTVDQLRNELKDLLTKLQVQISEQTCLFIKIKDSDEKIKIKYLIRMYIK